MQNFLKIFVMGTHYLQISKQWVWKQFPTSPLWSGVDKKTFDVTHLEEMGITQAWLWNGTDILSLQKIYLPHCACSLLNIRIRSRSLAPLPTDELSGIRRKAGSEWNEIWAAQNLHGDDWVWQPGKEGQGVPPVRADPTFSTLSELLVEAAPPPPSCKVREVEMLAHDVLRMCPLEQYDSGTALRGLCSPNTSLASQFCL